MLTVREATEADIDLVAEIGASGFHEDPVLSWVFPDVSTRRERLRTLFGAVASDFLADGRVEIADDACVAMWRDPAFDHFAEDGGEDDAPPFDDGELERLGLLITAMAEHHPHEPHWYLLALSCMADRQGQGLGGAALSARLARADEEGAAAYLESTNPRNMTLYRRHGFEQTGEIQLPGGPSLFPMWRSPRR
jgi:GNAT superfamily N-acetyltransferase